MGSPTRRFDRSYSLPIFFASEDSSVKNKRIKELVETLLSNKKNFLNLNSLGLTRIPQELCLLKEVKYDQPDIHLSLSYNDIAEINGCLFECKKVTSLSLNFNRIQTVPQDIFKLRELKVLDLSNNFIRCLPAEIKMLNLDVLYVQTNSFIDVEEANHLNSKLIFDAPFASQELSNTRVNVFKNRNLKDFSLEIPMLCCSVCRKRTLTYQKLYKFTCVFNVNVPLEYILCSKTCYNNILNA